VTFGQKYLQDLYVSGRTSEKKYRFQPGIVRKYIKVISIMVKEDDISGLMKYGSLHYEHLHGEKEGLSSVRVNDKYRIEFKEAISGNSKVADICNITELSNHYE